MGKDEKITLVKIGGSVITEKEKPLTPNLRNIRLIGKELSRASISNPRLRYILIHGGGSYGHYYAKKFRLGTNVRSAASPEGLARTAASMIELHSIVLEELCIAGVYCGTVLPIELFSQIDEPITISGAGKYRLNSVLRNDLIPITFGYVNLVGNKSYIISGDKIALALARALPVVKTIFVMDVDGVFRSPEMNGSIIRELREENFSVESSTRGYDVTGGIKAKISAGFEIAKLGSDVYFLNGSKRNRLLGVLRGSGNAVATKIYSTKKSAP